MTRAPNPRVPALGGKVTRSFVLLGVHRILHNQIYSFHFSFRFTFTDILAADPGLALTLWLASFTSQASNSPPVHTKYHPMYCLAAF